MSLPHVILTVLSTKDATGYDITKEFSQSIGYFWKASHQQVYRELNKMASNELVTCILIPQQGKPDRKVYSITEAGKESLFQWFQEPTFHSTIRDEFTAKLLVCEIYNSEPMQFQLASLIEESKSLLNNYRSIEETHFSSPSLLNRQARLERLTLRRNIIERQGWIVWAEEVMNELKHLDSPTAIAV
ncbi:PadR family transcriptional regulator [Aliivibrio kagoshimensis]|jgi:PadR family transcriptional regulator AphA|uniref:PadR family transcriptional regulator n=1 Tax=Aliivibrio kagoshimensis TaxID=2910230 RepID=UPI003D0A581E